VTGPVFARLLGAVLLLAGAVAQTPRAGAQDWSFTLTPNIWLPSTDVSVATPQGDVDASISARDALSDLDFALMGTFEARQGRWSLIGDIVHTQQTARERTPFGALFSRAEVRTRLTTLSGHALYRVHEDPALSLDLGAGLRGVRLDTKTRLIPNMAPETVTSRTEDRWLDPVIAARAIVRFDERWSATVIGDIGGFASSSRSTGQAAITIGYDFNDARSLHVGYRYLRLKRTSGDVEATTTLSGPVVGLSFRF
jgi:hypothetical protein